MLPFEARADADVVQLSHVLLKVEISAESFCADFAREGFLIVVGVHVKGEIVDLMKRLVADGTLVGLISAVRQLVVFVVSLLMKALSTVFANVRFVTGVDTSMGVQCRRAVKRLSTRLTFMWFLRRVDDLVSTQSGRLTESFATDFADERTCTGVDWHMAGEIVMGIEHFTTLRASKRLLLC